MSPTNPLFTPTISPSQLRSLSTDEIERLIEQDGVNVKKGSKEAKFHNWAKTFYCEPERVFKPTTVDHVLLITELSRRHNKPLRPAGVGHSPSDLACTSSYMVLTTSLSHPISLNPIPSTFSPSTPTSSAKALAHVQAGITLHSLHAWLEAQKGAGTGTGEGWAMENCGSISDQTLGGVVTTCTHGSGWNFEVLTSMVQEVGVVVAGGDREGGVRLVRCSREVESDLFNATVCGLGLTGIITDLKIRVEPSFRLRQVNTPYNLPSLLSFAPSSPPTSDDRTPLLSNVANEAKFGDMVKAGKFEDFGQGMLDQISQSAEHVRMWWWPQTDGVVVGRADRVYEEPKRPSAISSFISKLLNFHTTQFLLFIAKFAPRFTTVVGRWTWWLQSRGGVDVGKGYEVFTFDCLFPQYTTEWAIPYENTRSALLELRSWIRSQQADPKGERVHWPIEIRFSKPDEIWLSPSYGRRTTWIGVVQYRPYGYTMPYETIFQNFTAIMKKHDGRPHWAKQHDFTRGTLRNIYPKFDKFNEVREKWDPEGRWGCEYGERHFGGRGDEGEGKLLREEPQ